MKVEHIRLNDEHDFMLGMDNTPYDQDAMFGRPNSDVYKVNLSNGSKTLLYTKVRRIYSISPDGKPFAY